MFICLSLLLLENNFVHCTLESENTFKLYEHKRYERTWNHNTAISFSFNRDDRPTVLSLINNLRFNNYHLFYKTIEGVETNKLKKSDIYNSIHISINLIGNKSIRRNRINNYAKAGLFDVLDLLKHSSVHEDVFRILDNKHVSKTVFSSGNFILSLEYSFLFKLQSSVKQEISRLFIFIDEMLLRRGISGNYKISISVNTNSLESIRKNS